MRLINSKLAVEVLSAGDQPQSLNSNILPLKQQEEPELSRLDSMLECIKACIL